ncbi:hypothetical protein MMC08_008611 [Hypocenomyce scalaris]|nr:hypothetical protein [Hypocenomyce scalaris]
MSKLIGIIIGSTRPKCNGKPIAAWIHKTILQHSSSGSCSYEIVDLAHWNLPLFDEPGVPARDAPVREHTKAWQAKVKTLDGFVFVTPQYNWGYPAALKNALDYLFHEWTGKPAVIISYGSRGGGKAAAQLQQPIPDMPAMALSETLLLGGAGSAEQGGHVEFSEHSESILAAVQQLEKALEAM